MTLPVDAAYAVLAALAFVLALAFVPFARWIGGAFGIVDAVNPAKIHTRPMVRCGGLGIYLAFVSALALALAAVWVLRGTPMMPAGLADYAGNTRFVAGKLAALLAGATLMFVTGLVDDKRNLRPGVKLALQVLSAVPLIAAGITVRFFVPGWIAGALMTVAWIVLITNALNFLDNMNGLAGGVAAICALNFFLVSRAGGEFFMMAMFALLAGAAAGFIPYNFPRARLFMGDSGSLFLGYMLAALSILVTYYREGVPTALPVVAPLVILGVPIFDTAGVMFIRWRAGRPLMRGDQSHFSHRLVALGFSRRDAVLFIWLATLTVGLTAVNLRHLGMGGALVALAQVALFFLLIWFLERVAARR
jgi:UDP-GlcNAc:undecaprenyl-phosphate GlcNAc-1-phosphate transferase